jgi:hypothetical protein
MADSKLIINKHFRNPESINKFAFTGLKKINFYGLGKDELMREGEIIICNDPDTPGIYIMTAGELEGKVINITSAENIKLNGYTISVESGTALTITSADTIDEAFGKAAKHLLDLQEEVDNIEVSTGIEEIKVITETEPFIGDDGNEYPAGVYLYIKYKKNADEYGYVYYDITNAFAKERYLEQEEYDALVEAGEVDPDTTYYIYED